MIQAAEPDLRRDRWVGLGLSVSVHLAVLFLWGWSLFQSAQYGIETGSGGLELTLVAAPPRRASPGALPREESSPEAFVLSGLRLRAPVRAATVSGDGSSPVPGQDPTTFYSQGGGQSEAEAGPLKNPVPPYPPAARRLGQEGLVVLQIAIDRMGQPARVEIQKSSGYALLDESALTTVRRWEFIPARTAGRPRDSVASLRVSFVLKENEE